MIQGSSASFEVEIMLFMYLFFLFNHDLDFRVLDEAWDPFRRGFLRRVSIDRCSFPPKHWVELSKLRLKIFKEIEAFLLGIPLS
jgi:hypothetical protein